MEVLNHKEYQPRTTLAKELTGVCKGEASYFIEYIDKWNTKSADLVSALRFKEMFEKVYPVTPYTNIKQVPLGELVKDKNGREFEIQGVSQKDLNSINVQLGTKKITDYHWVDGVSLCRYYTFVNTGKKVGIVDARTG